MCVCVCVLCRVQFFMTPWAVTPPGSSIHGILQARILQWLFPPPGDLPHPGIEPMSLALAGRFFTAESPSCNIGGWGTMTEWGRFPGIGNGDPLQYSCLENSTDRGAWWANVHRVARVGHNLVTKPPNYNISHEQKYN